MSFMISFVKTFHKFGYLIYVNFFFSLKWILLRFFKRFRNLFLKFHNFFLSYNTSFPFFVFKNFLDFRFLGFHNNLLSLKFKLVRFFLLDLALISFGRQILNYLINNIQGTLFWSYSWYFFLLFVRLFQFSFGKINILRFSQLLSFETFFYVWISYLLFFWLVLFCKQFIIKHIHF